MLQLHRAVSNQLPETDTLADEWEDLFPDDDARIQNTMDATIRINTIRQLEGQIQQLEKQDEESRIFYTAKKAKCTQRIETIKRSILGYLQFAGLKNIQTPSGTAYQKAVTVKAWPTDEILLSWALSSNSALIRIKREPDKRLMADHIKATGECPPGYTESQETRLYIR
jgi:hypothetical protein